METSHFISRNCNTSPFSHSKNLQWFSIDEIAIIHWSNDNLLQSLLLGKTVRKVNWQTARSKFLSRSRQKNPQIKGTEPDETWKQIMMKGERVGAIWRRRDYLRGPHNMYAQRDVPVLQRLSFRDQNKQRMNIWELPHSLWQNNYFEREPRIFIYEIFKNIRLICETKILWKIKQKYV